MYKRSKSELNVFKELQMAKKNLYNVNVDKFKKISVKDFINKF